jgi:glycosyltransferase involved in cell wall biosynthesis
LSVFLVDGASEPKGGPRQSLYLARELRSKGRPFELVVDAGSPLHEEASSDKLPVLPLKMAGGGRWFGALRLARAMKRRRAALVHFQDVESLAFGARAAALAKVPLRVLTRRADSPIHSPRASIKAIDAVIAASEGVRAILVRGGVPEGLVEVIPPGIDFSPFRSPGSEGFLREAFFFAPDVFLVGVVALLSDDKNLRAVLEAAEIVRSNAPNVRIVILGEGGFRLEHEETALSGSGENVAFYMGFPEDAIPVLASLDVFVMSSPLEGLRASLMQAMARGLPVIATDVGRIPELVAHRRTGLLVPPRRAKALADAVLKLYLDRKLGSRLGAGAAEAVQEKYSAEAMARNVIAFYESVAARKGVRIA